MGRRTRRHCPLRCKQTSRDLALWCCASEPARWQKLPWTHCHACPPCCLRARQAAVVMARSDSQWCGVRRSRKENKHRACRRHREHAASGDLSRLRVGRRRIAACGCARFQLVRRFTQFCGNFAQKFRAAALRFRRDFLLDVAAQACQFFIDAFPELSKFVHKRVRRTAHGDFGIIGTLRECRKEESWRFPINGNTGWTAGKRRCKVFSAAATSSRVPKFAPPAVRWWASRPRVATSAARTLDFPWPRSTVASPEFSRGPRRSPPRCSFRI